MKKILTFLFILVAGIGLAACNGGSSEDKEQEQDKEQEVGGEEKEGQDTQPDTGSFNLDGDIKVYTRDSASGTRDAFFSIIGFDNATDDTKLPKGTVTVSSNGDMITKIKADSQSIGYISFSSYDPKELKGLSVGGVEPSDEAVIDGSYELARNFNYVIRDDADFASDREKHLTHAFVKFLSTTTALTTVKQNSGIVDVPEDAQPWNDETISTLLTPEELEAVKADNKDYTLRLGGSTSVQKIATALANQFSELAGNVQINSNHTGSGDAYKRTQGSEKDSANLLHIGFLSRELKDSEPAVDGTAGFLCKDAIVVVVHKDNTALDNVKVTLALLKSIFYNDENLVTKWKDLA